MVLMLRSIVDKICTCPSVNFSICLLEYVVRLNRWALLVLFELGGDEFCICLGLKIR